MGNHEDGEGPMTHRAYTTGYGYTPPAPRKRRRIFMWFFLAIQALFLVWLIGGIMSARGIPSYCHQGNHSQYIGVKGCTSASQAGAAIGAALVIAFWAVVDIILGVSYGVYRLATRARMEQS